MKYLILLMSLLFSTASVAQDYKPMLPVDSIDSSMRTVEKRVRGAAVKVTFPFEGGHGSGSYLKYKDIHIVITAQHVARGKIGENYMVSHGGESHISMLIYSDPADDIAVLFVKTPFRSIEPMPFKTPGKDCRCGYKHSLFRFPFRSQTKCRLEVKLLVMKAGRVSENTSILQTYGWFGVFRIRYI